MNLIFTLWFLAIGGFNLYSAIDSFSNGLIGLGVFNVSIAVLSYVFMFKVIFEGRD